MKIGHGRRCKVSACKRTNKHPQRTAWPSHWSWGRGRGGDRDQAGERVPRRVVWAENLSSHGVATWFMWCMWQRTSCKADEEEIEFGKGVIICDEMPPFLYISPINSGENATSHKVLILYTEPRMKEKKAFGSFSVPFSSPGFTFFSWRERTVFAAKKSHDFADLEGSFFPPNLSLNRWGNLQKLSRVFLL